MTAFTIVDLVLALLIVSILAAVAAPAWRAAVSKMQLEAAADRLVWDLRMLQSTAIARSTPGSVQFFEGEDRYVADILSDPRTGTPPYEVRLRRMSSSLDLYSVPFPTGTLVFSETGLPSAAGSIVLRAGGWEVRVRVRANGTIERSDAVPADSAAVAAPP